MGTGKGLIGSALYTCPDSARGFPITTGYDMYSLGVVFYEMVTGKVPFAGTDFYTIMRKHEDAVPVAPRKFNQKIPVEIEKIIMKMLEKDPNKRFRSTKELLINLRDYLNK